MKNMKAYFIRRKYIPLLVILVLLTANIGFIPNAYAASAGSTSSSLQSSNPSGNSSSAMPSGGSTDASGTGTFFQNDSAVVNVPASASSPSIAPPMMTGNENLTASVYSNNPNIIDKVIDYPAAPSIFRLRAPMRGETYQNDGRNGGEILLQGDYKEYGINPYVNGQNRGTE